MCLSRLFDIFCVTFCDIGYKGALYKNKKPFFKRRQKNRLGLHNLTAFYEKEKTNTICDGGFFANFRCGVCNIALTQSERKRIMTLQEMLSPKDTGKLRYISAQELLPNRSQPRRNFDKDALSALAQSIEKYGIIQPVTVREYRGKYEIIAGERRVRAARMAGLHKVPCILLDAGDVKSAEMAMVENLVRCDLDFFEQAEAIEKLLSEGGMTQERLAERLSMSQSALANKLRLLRYDGEQRKIILKSGMSERAARTVLRLPPEKRTKCLLHAAENSLGTAGIENYVTGLLCSMAANSGYERAAKQKKAKKQEEKSSPEGQMPVRRVLIGDLTLFDNSITRSVQLLRSAGYNANLRREESDGEVRYYVSVRNVQEHR